MSESTETRVEWRVVWKRPHWVTPNVMVTPDEGSARNYHDEVKSYADAPIEYNRIERRVLTVGPWEPSDG